MQMETWLLLTAYGKLPAPNQIALLPTPATYRLAAIPHNSHTVVRYDPSRSSIFMSFESQYAASY